ncbi:MAG: Gfo/Idh/MocA family oxidoreductase [Anaerolineae bacterium]|nr:Gfo/Idh/MocA family oxidoreductase [Anaerolineae bacterium]
MSDELRIGVIGFDTSHVPAFTRLLNDPEDPFHVPGGKVVAGYPSYSPDLEASYSRVEGFKREVTEKWGVRLVSSIKELLGQVDAVLLESVDGRRHLAEARPVIEARKPLFIDKPLAANYADAAEIYRLAQERGCPVFSASSLRFDANIVKVKEDPELGEVYACDAFSPAHLDPTNPGLFWYGIHGVEILYTFMGTGCEKVTCTVTDGYHLVVGMWLDGRIGTMRGIRRGALDYGATVFGEHKVAQATYSREIPLYSQLLKQIIPFFRGASAPVAPEETLEMMAFMQAALVSEQEGRDVTLDEVR